MSRPLSNFALLLAICLVAIPRNSPAIGQQQYVEESFGPGDFNIVQNGQTAVICADTNDFAGVLRAVRDLQADITRVTKITPSIVFNNENPGTNVIIIGTIGKCPMMDRVIRQNKIDVSPIAGKWESYIVQVVPHPLPGVASGLVIAGSDKRGTIYGIYDLSEQIGVSPWYWWADVPPKYHGALYVKPGRHVEGPPAVKYRGIFLNDEQPALGGWAKEKFGGFNHAFYTNVFELLLRLKANYLWPAMWDNSFDTDDPLNAPLADEYGIVIGTSHHEPMMRAWKEWERAGNPKGSWDYSKNGEKLRAYWREGIERTKDYDKIITLGMRGDGDEPMSETESVALLERIVADQRKIISETIHTNPAAVPQVWALYKEVQGYYERGMRVPDDVTLLWCDDNWGNLRRLPTVGERKRAGGAGIYYHLDYVGGPRSYRWLDTMPIPKIWEQINLAYQYGADRLWIVNVGDLKPKEIPLEFFLTFAWDPARWPADKIPEFTRLWAAREFGPKYAPEIADIVEKYTKYNGRRTPELLEPGTFSAENYQEADMVVADWQAISDQAEAIYAKLPEDERAAFYQLVLYPTKASAVVNELYAAVAKNRLYASWGLTEANDYARQAREFFRQDADLTDYYNHTLAGGKWDHIMDQVHIGYANWHEPQSNTLPAVVEVPLPESVKSITNDITKLAEIRPVPLAACAGAEGQGFVEKDGYVSIEAEHFTHKVDVGPVRWEKIPGYGRTLSAMTVFPVTAQSVTPPRDSPCLEYQMCLYSTGTVEVTSVLSPGLNFDPRRAVRLAVSFDDEPPQVLTVVPKNYSAGEGNLDWEKSVEDGVRTVKSKHNLAEPGSHTLKIWMVDPAVVVEKLIVNAGGLKPSYFGPPESLSQDSSLPTHEGPTR